MAMRAGGWGIAFFPDLSGEGCLILCELSSFSFFSLSSFSSFLSSFCRHLCQTWTRSFRLQWAAPDLNRELQIAVGSAGLQQIAVDSTGPHPGGSGADWATPDLTRGPPERSGQRRTSAARRYVRWYVKNMSEKNARRYARRNVRRYVNRNVG